MSTFGRHSAFVEEVLGFVENGQILKKRYQPVDEVIGITTRTIFQLGSIERFRDPDWPNSEIKDDMDWTDIQRTDEHLFSSDWSEEFKEISQPAIEAIQPVFWNSLEHHLNNFLPYGEIQEIEGFLYHLLYLRGALGKTDSFDERLFKVYQAGGYPCGWSGRFPEGELVVYSRS